MIELKAQLDAIDPRLFFVALGLLVFLVIYVWRKVFPNLFEQIPKTWQSLPAIILGACLGASATAQEIKEAVIGAVVGALTSGLAAIGGHHALKAAPGPYGGTPPPVVVDQDQGESHDEPEPTQELADEKSEPDGDDEPEGDDDDGPQIDPNPTPRFT